MYRSLRPRRWQGDRSAVESCPAAPLKPYAGRSLSVRRVPTGAPATGKCRRIREAADDDHAVDFTAQEGLQEGVVVLEGDAPIRLAARTQHVAVSQDAVATEHLVL